MVARAAPLRVAHLLLGGDVDGIGLHVLDLAAAQTAQGTVQPLVITCPSPAYLRRLAQAGVPTRALASRKLLPAVLRTLRAGLVPGPIDLVHLHGFRASQLLLTAGAVRPRAVSQQPIVATCHGLFDDTLRRRLRRRTEIRSYASLRLLITTNPDQGHIAARAAQPPPAIQYVPNGIAVTGHAGRAAPQHLRARYGLPTECEIVASVGRLATEKRHDVFLRACSTIAQSRPRTHFIIAGIGPKRAGLERLARDFGIHDRVHFARLVDDIPALLSVVTVLMHTSDAEGTPRAVLEAMAAGVPVVATAVGGVPDLVENGRTGVLVPRRAPSALADATVRLLSDVDARERMGALARRRVESLFSAAIMAERTEALYRRYALDGAWVTS